jgi:integrase
VPFCISKLPSAAGLSAICPIPTSKSGKTKPHNTKKITAVLNAANRSLFSIDAALKRIHLNILRGSCSERDYRLMRVLWRSGIRINELLNLRP